MRRCAAACISDVCERQAPDSHLRTLVDVAEGPEKRVQLLEITRHGLFVHDPVGGAAGQGTGGSRPCFHDPQRRRASVLVQGPQS